MWNVNKPPFVIMRRRTAWHPLKLIIFLIVRPVVYIRYSSSIRKGIDFRFIQKMTVKKAMVVRAEINNVVSGHNSTTRTGNDISDFDEPTKAAQNTFSRFSFLIYLNSIARRRSVSSCKALGLVCTFYRAIKTLCPLINTPSKIKLFATVQACPNDIEPRLMSSKFQFLAFMITILRAEFSTVTTTLRSKDLFAGKASDFHNLNYTTATLSLAMGG